MAVSIKSVLERVVGMLEDETSVTWTLADLVRYANDGQTDMLVRRPDLFVASIEHPLVAGWRQNIPTDCTKLVEIDGNAVGTLRACTKTQRALLDAQVPGWRGMTQVLEPEHFMFDDREPQQFDVYPPAKVGARLFTRCVRRPTPIPAPAPSATLASLAGDIGIPDEMNVALQHYITARCYAEGGEDANLPLAEKHLSLYANTLGVEVEATRAVAPTNSK